MKKFAIALAALLICSPAFAGTIKLSSTIGPVDAGIIPLLAETFKAKTGTEFVIEKAGTGATLEKAKGGDFDMVVVHARALEDKFIISAIKGIIPGSWQTVAEYLHDHYSLSFRQMGIIAGPTHAEEVSRGKLSFLTLASADEKNARTVGEKLSSKYIHINYSSDLYGVEYASILKNIYALSAGLAKGLGYGDNFIAVLVANCANEMTRFIEESYPYSRNTFTSAYLGDLLVTCYSSYSRNRRLGLLIGHGCTVKSALNEMTMIAEGYYAAECIRHINLKHKVSMPIADMVYEVLYRNRSPRKAMAELSTILDMNC